MKTLHLLIILILSVAVIISINVVFAQTDKNTNLMMVVKIGNISRTDYQNGMYNQKVEFGGNVGTVQTGQPVIIKIFKNDFLYRTDSIPAGDIHLDKLFWYQTTVTGKPGLDLYKIDFIYGNQTVEEILPALHAGVPPVLNLLSLPLSPLKQFKSGVAANNIICRSDLQLLVHQKEKRPICVNPDSVTNLIKRGWEIPTHCDYKINFTYDLLGEVVIEKNASSQDSGKSYHPITGTVVIGFNNTVQWDNVDDFPSSVTSDWGLFDSGPILPDHYWRYNFECTGTYGYHSEPHPWMHGWITVLPPSGLK